MGFSSGTISYVHSQQHSDLPKGSSDDPSMLLMKSINYVKSIICIEKVNNTTKAIKTLYDIANTLFSSKTVCYQLTVRGMRLVIKGKSYYSTSQLEEFAERHLE